MTRTPNTSIVWKPTRPELTIQVLRSTSTNRGYHEAWYEVTSRQALTAEDFVRLDECGLLGIGQCYNVESEAQLTDNVPAVVVDDRTGAPTGEVPCRPDGTLIDATSAYSYTRYVVKRICDSGD